MAQRFWFQDPSHFPRPVSPVAATFDLPAMADGFTAAADELRRPLAGKYTRVAGGYAYFGIDIPRSPAALAAARAAYEETVSPRIEGALAAWIDSYLPEAERLNAEMLALAEKQDADAAFADALDAVVALRARQWAIHDLALVPAMEAAGRFTAAYADRCGGAAALQTLLEGFPNRATRLSEALDALVEQIREATSTIVDVPLEDRKEVRPAIDAFLREHGRRSGAWDVGDPTWAEDPRPVYRILEERLRRPAAEPGAHRREAEARRERAVQTALAALAADDRPAFMRALTAAQAYPVVSEDHNAVIDQEGMAALRAVLLAAGRRLGTAGRLARAEDVVWLTRAEVQGALRGGALPAGLPSRRRAWRRRRERTRPPRTLGRALPAWAADDPTLVDFFGLGGEPESAPLMIRGAGVSGGVASGRAVVVATLDDAERIEPGDILVCPMTSPAWTPWLAMIAGAVVETGGMLSHTAVLAREYGFPCVVQAANATSVIPDGATVQVDGADGVVTWTAASPPQ